MVRTFIALLLLFCTCTARSQNIASDSLKLQDLIAQQLHFGEQPVFHPIAISADMNEMGRSFSIEGLHVRFEHLEDPEGFLWINKKKYTLSHISPVGDTVSTLESFCPDTDDISLVEFAKKKYLYIPGYICRCNGSGCGVRYFIIYDISNKTLNAFSNFRLTAKAEALLCNANNDRYLDFISVDGTGWAGDSDLGVFRLGCYFINASGKAAAYRDKIIKGSYDLENDMVINVDNVRWFRDNNLSSPLKDRNISK